RWTLAAAYASRMLPQIFRPDDPLLQVTLAPEDKRTLERLVADLPTDVFTADDSLGWCYQFWQTKRKEEVNKSEVKIGADELPAVTQLFTEDYMVRFLLHNSLGAWWSGKQQSSGSTEDQLRKTLSDTLEDYEFDYLRFVEDDGTWKPASGTFDGWPGKAADLKILDPCCGSGHFLVVVFELMAFAINVTIAAMSSLITLITLGPVGILAAIVAVVVGFDLFGVVVKKTLGAVDSGFNAARGAIVGTADAIVGIKDAVVSTGAGVRSFGQTIRQTFAGAFAVVKSGFRTLVVDVGASWKTLQVLLSTGNFSEAWKLGITLAKLEWVKFKHWMLNLWDSIAPSVNKAIVAAADSIGGTLANLKIGWGNIWDTLLSGLRTFLSALDTALGEIQLRIVTIQAFFGEDTSKSGLPPLLTGLVPAGRSAEEKKTEDAAAIAQGKSVAEAIKTALVTGEKTPAELVAAIAAREKELADAINDHKDALVAAKKAAEEAVKKQQAGAGGAGAGGVGGRGGGGGAVAALAAPIGIALTATHSAAAARISGFQPGGPQQKMADGIQRIAELNEKQLESLDKFLAGWRVA
ncbi:hypothetical protein LCGC14_0727910, partial [marine sediment metagenome]